MGEGVGVAEGEEGVGKNKEARKRRGDGAKKRESEGAEER